MEGLRFIVCDSYTSIQRFFHGAFNELWSILFFPCTKRLLIPRGKQNLIITLLLLRSLWACGVAWYPCGFGSHRLAFKSQQAHASQNQREKLKEFLGLVKLEQKSNHWLKCVSWWLTDFVNNVDINNISEVTNYLGNLQSKVSGASYRKRFYQIRRFLREAFDLHYLDKMRLPKLTIQLPKIVTEKDIKTAIACFKDSKFQTRNRALILLACSSGLRPSELFKLTINDIDLENRIIYVRNTKTKIDRVTFFDSKTEIELKRYIRLNKNKILFNQSTCMRAFRKTNFRVKFCRKYFSQEWTRRNGNQAVKEMLLGHSLKGNVDAMHYCALSEEDLHAIYKKVME